MLAVCGDPAWGHTRRNAPGWLFGTMSSKLSIGWKLGLAAILLLMVGLGEWRQYMKYLDGRGIYSFILGPSASIAAEITVFIVPSILFVVGVFWYALRDFK